MSDLGAGRPDGRRDLRERRRVRTKMLVQTEALRLFAEKGYEQTTIDDIAHAAAMSPRTFFRYFPSKEDVVLWDEYDERKLGELWVTPAVGDPLLQVVSIFRETLTGLYAHDRERLLARVRLSFEVPQIRARFLDAQITAIGPFYAELLTLLGLDQDDLRLRVNLAALFAAVIVAVERWQHDDGREDLIELLDRSIDAMAEGMSDLQSSLHPPRGRAASGKAGSGSRTVAGGRRHS